MKPLRRGMKVVIFEGEKEIDVGVILEKTSNKNTEIISFESLKLFPKEKSKFALMDEGWKVLFPDPMTGQTVFSTRGKSYGIKPIP